MAVGLDTKIPTTSNESLEETTILIQEKSGSVDTSKHNGRVYTWFTNPYCQCIEQTCCITTVAGVCMGGCCLFNGAGIGLAVLLVKPTTVGEWFIAAGGGIVAANVGLCFAVGLLSMFKR